MKTKFLVGLLAILAVLFGILLLMNTLHLGGLSATPTFTPSLTWTETASVSPTVSETPTLAVAGDLGLGQVRGVVTDSQTGMPVPGAVVTCTQTSYFPRALCNGLSTTAGDGSFVFDGVFFHDTDSITLQVSAPGYTAQTVHSAFFTSPGMTVSLGLVPAGLAPSTPGTPTLTPTPFVVCTPPPCAIGTGEAYTCNSGNCPGGCGTSCATYTPTP